MTKGLPVHIKYLFLRFVQAYFSEYDPAKWDSNLQTTNIIIADRSAIDLGITIKRPSIILSRGDLGWTFSVRGQDGINSQQLNKWLENQGSTLAPPQEIPKIKTDLLQASVVFNVISQNGVFAEQLASYLFTGLTGFKDELRQAGIHQITGLSLGSERIIRNNSEIEMVGVPINLSFLMKIDIYKGEDFYLSSLSSDSNKYYENIHYSVVSNGTAIRLLEDLDDSLTIDYTDAITLEEKQTTLVATEDENIYSLADGGSIYGYYIFNELDLTSQIDSNQEYVDD